MLKSVNLLRYCTFGTHTFWNNIKCHDAIWSPFLMTYWWILQKRPSANRPCYSNNWMRWHGYAGSEEAASCRVRSIHNKGRQDKLFSIVCNQRQQIKIVEWREDTRFVGRFIVRFLRLEDAILGISSQLWWLTSFWSPYADVHHHQPHLINIQLAAHSDARVMSAAVVAYWRS